jgi:Tol biopolymer transport system component
MSIRTLRPLLGLALLTLSCSSSPATPPDARGDVIGLLPDVTVAIDAPRLDSGPFIPTPADIQFTAVHPLPSGEQILFNNWDANPNAVFSMTPDGKTVTEVFRAFRVWSMGTSRAGDRIAFACGDPQQALHYGVTIGDAIQHTWIYDVATQTAAVVAHGNINDECHVFAPGDAALYVCRRYDFTNTTNKGWRLGRLDLPAKTFSFLTDDVAMEFHLSPQPTLDGKSLYFARIQISGGKQQTAIMRLPLPGGTAEVVRASAKGPMLSPDGTRLLFQDTADQGHLYAVGLDGSNLIKVAAAAGTSARYSPDGKQVAYLLFDSAKSCSHLDVVKADGTEAQAPRRLRDCGTTGEFISDLDWITR